MTDQIAQSLGFNDAVDLFRLTANAPIDTPEKLAAFKAWQHDDGTKAGLLAIMNQKPRGLVVSNKVDLEKLVALEGELTWCLSSSYGDEAEEGPVVIAICDDNERVCGIKLVDLLKADEEFFRSEPSNAQWTARKLRLIADKLDSFTGKAVACSACDELTNPNCVDHCAHCGEFSLVSRTATESDPIELPSVSDLLNAAYKRGFVDGQSDTGGE